HRRAAGGLDGRAGAGGGAGADGVPLLRGLRAGPARGAEEVPVEVAGAVRGMPTVFSPLPQGERGENTPVPGLVMIDRVIEFSIRRRGWVIAAAAVLAAWGAYAVSQTPVDAIPDLSESQVLVYTDWPGRGPREVEDQVTYP